jgi:hypothetical protein
MAIRQMHSDDLIREDYVPQAVIQLPISYFERRLRLTFINGCDDLDTFEGAALALDSDVTFLLKGISKNG